MTLSRFLRDFLYIPLGGNRGGKLQDRAQPDDHDGARRPLARRGLGLRAVGHAARRSASWSSTRCAGGSSAAGLAALGDRLQRRRVRLDPVPRREPRPRRSPSSRQLGDPGPATLWAPVTLAAVIGVIGFQLLPPDPLERLRLRVARSARLRARLRARRGGGARRRYGPEPGRSALHLLPVLTCPSTYRSPAPARTAHARARRARRRVPLRGRCWCCSRARRSATAGEEMQPGLERDVVRAVGKPAGWVADRLPFDEWSDDALAFLEDEGAGERGRLRRGRARGRGRRRAARLTGLVRPRRARCRARAAAAARHAARDRRLAGDAARRRDGAPASPTPTTR